MKTEKEIRFIIKEIKEQYKHVLDCYPATAEVNAPRALMQVAAISTFDTLYMILGEKRPRFKCDESNKANHH